jgi:hypothetical protein
MTQIINSSGAFTDIHDFAGEVFYAKRAQASHFDQVFTLEEGIYSRYRFHLACHNQRLALNAVAGETLTIQQYIANNTNMTKSNLMTFRGGVNDGQLWGLTYIRDQEYVGELTLSNSAPGRWEGLYNVIFSDVLIRHHLTLNGSHIHFLETVSNDTHSGEYSLVGQRWAA